MAELRVGLIGHGSIGAAVERLLAAEESVQIVGILVRSPPSTEAGSEALSTPFFTDIRALLQAQPDIVVECAGHAAVQAYAKQVLDAGCDFMAVSVGALAVQLDSLTAVARANGRRIVIPAGAVGGLDFLQASRLAGLDTVRYRSRKPPAAWLGSAAEALIDLHALTEAVTFYRGTARAAATDFPKNANVAATVALATLGLDNVQVELVADPQARHNSHEIEALGAAGTISVCIKARPSEQNPRTSMITAYSVVHALLRQRATVVM